jgi:hypothetical protein
LIIISKTLTYIILTYYLLNESPPPFHRHILSYYCHWHCQCPTLACFSDFQHYPVSNITQYPNFPMSDITQCPKLPSVWRYPVPSITQLLIFPSIRYYWWHSDPQYTQCFALPSVPHYKCPAFFLFFYCDGEGESLQVLMARIWGFSLWLAWSG